MRGVGSSVWNEGSHSPGRSHSQSKYESYADETSRRSVAAPALEHSNHSNDEKYDSQRTERFKPHVFVSMLIFASLAAS